MGNHSNSKSMMKPMQTAFWGFAIDQQARRMHPAESRSSSWGLVFPSPLLPTPPFGDAVTVRH
jgi:hypothetical protein